MLRMLLFILIIELLWNPRKLEFAITHVVHNAKLQYWRMVVMEVYNRENTPVFHTSKHSIEAGSCKGEDAN